MSKIDLLKSNAPDGVSTTLTGFGFQENDNETGHMSQILQKLTVKIVNQEECKQQLENYEIIKPQHLCGFTGPLYGACYVSIIYIQFNHIRFYNVTHWRIEGDKSGLNTVKRHNY